MLIGLDVGWSEQRRTCGVAVLGARLEAPDKVTQGDITAVALNKRDVTRVLSPVVHRALMGGTRILIVADAIVGPERVPPANRRVDSGCSSGGFYRRAQSFPATQPAGRSLSTTLHDILDELLAETGGEWTPWLGGGPPPSSGVVVVETHPTTSMALAFSLVDQASLPTRRSPRRLRDGTKVRAKSDWYWRSGAGELAALILGAPGVREECDHERIAGLWCLALAHELDASREVALLGDASGTYLVGSIDPSWAADVERVGVRWGQVRQIARTLVRLDSTAERVVGISAREKDANGRSNDDADDVADDALGDDVVRVRFTDTGGLSLKANPWLGSVDVPCHLLLHGKTTVEVTVTPFAPPNDRSQFRVGPTTIRELMRAWGGPLTLRDGNGFEVHARVL